jgi:hypothetical protein
VYLDWFAAINDDFRISFRMVLVKKGGAQTALVN